jgi:hypothetical protein
MREPSAPALSVVIVVVGDTITGRCSTSELAGMLDALARQDEPPATEIIVPYHAGIDGIDALARQYPEVTFLPAADLRSRRRGSREHHDELRARGALAARGRIVAFLEDHVRPGPGWCAAILEAHKRPFAVIGGAIQNGVNRPLNWAAYFCDLGRYQNPVPEGASAFASTVNNSYKRSVLERIRPVWKERFNETTVNAAVVALGEKLALCGRIVVYQHRLDLRAGVAAREFFIWGRSYARTRCRLMSRATRLFYFAFSPALPGIMLWRMLRNVIQKRTCVGTFLKVLPVTAVMASMWSCGEMAGYAGAPAER